MKFSTPAQTETSLRETLPKLQALVADMVRETTNREKTEPELRADEIAWEKNFADADLTDDDVFANIVRQRSKLDLRQRHYTGDFARRKIFDALLRELEEVGGLIRQAVQPRHSAETAIAASKWAEALAGILCEERENQYSKIRRVAAEAISQLSILLEAKRGTILNPEERRTGFLRDGKGFALRALTAEEIQFGVAQT